MNINPTKCAWFNTPNKDEWDPDGCEECDWETWRCHQAAIQVLQLAASTIKVPS